MKHLMLITVFIFLLCSSNYLILDSVEDAKYMNYKIVEVDTLENGLYRVWVK